MGATQVPPRGWTLLEFCARAARDLGHFNTMLMDVGRAKGAAYHKATSANVLTKRDLEELVQTRENLVREMASFGADIPTTPMFWKRETNRLQWIVRQMSWEPPWVPSHDDDQETPPSAPPQGSQASPADTPCSTPPAPLPKNVDAAETMPKKSTCAASVMPVNAPCLNMPQVSTDSAPGPVPHCDACPHPQTQTGPALQRCSQR